MNGIGWHSWPRILLDCCWFMRQKKKQKGKDKEREGGKELVRERERKKERRGEKQKIHGSANK